MTPLNYYTMPEVMAFLGETEGQIFRDIDEERLPICFSCDGDLDGVCIERPDGTFENVALTVPFKGILRSLVPPKSPDLLVASLVQLLASSGYTLVHENKVLVKGCVLPLTDNRISKGFTVTGFLNFSEVPVSEWLFLGSDVLGLVPNEKQPILSARQKDRLLSALMLVEAVAYKDETGGDTFGYSLNELARGAYSLVESVSSGGDFSDIPDKTIDMVKHFIKMIVEDEAAEDDIGRS